MPLTREEKSAIFAHHLDGVACVCGRPKNPRQWVCRDCRKRDGDTPEGHALDAACMAHAEAARAFMERCRVSSTRAELQWRDERDRYINS